MENKKDRRPAHSQQLLLNLPTRVLYLIHKFNKTVMIPHYYCIYCQSVIYPHQMERTCLHFKGTVSQESDTFKHVKDV